ncbi:hypothetical protein [Microvirga sp. 2TAF3]|uniref:hypothetical protein n=1 Tax=Microvirga sp. 2TAF3 TaxID=3233014 RepID=UPI003F969024
MSTAAKRSTRAWPVTLVSTAIPFASTASYLVTTKRTIETIIAATTRKNSPTSIRSAHTAAAPLALVATAIGVGRVSACRRRISIAPPPLAGLLVSAVPASAL